MDGVAVCWSVAAYIEASKLVLMHHLVHISFERCPSSTDGAIVAKSVGVNHAYCCACSSPTIGVLDAHPSRQLAAGVGSMHSLSCRAACTVFCLVGGGLAASSCNVVLSACQEVDCLKMDCLKALRAALKSAACLTPLWSWFAIYHAK